jgi:hypothetical protein
MDSQGKQWAKTKLTCFFNTFRVAQPLAQPLAQPWMTRAAKKNPAIVLREALTDSDL